MTTNKPYFLSNKEWYYYDRENFCYKLTDKAPEKARKSFEEYYQEMYLWQK